MSMTVEDVLKEAEKINKQVAVHNQNNSKNEGIRIAKKQEIEKLFASFNAKHGTQLTPDNTEGIEQEYQSSAYGAFNETKHLKQVLQAIEEGNISEVMSLTGVDVAQDTLKIPRMHVDLDELEKQAGNSLKIQQEDTNLLSGIVDDSEQIVETNEEVLSITEEESEEQQSDSSKDLQNFFQSQVNQGKANQEANQISQAVANQQTTIQVPTQEVETPVQEEKKVEAPKFNFAQPKQEPVAETPVQEEKKAEAPKFSFGVPQAETVVEEQPKQETQAPTGGISFGISEEPQAETTKAPSFGQAFAQNKEVVEEKKEEAPRKGKVQFSFQPKEEKEETVNIPKPIPVSGVNLEDALASQGQSMPKFDIGGDIDIVE
ncbi:hypothetical protein ACQUY5_25915 [Bacillus cereus]|uniref:hypothetical protein n=1 Tax=Bacillus cereus TaxID=1396 RepID=UPI003D16359D